MESEGRKSGDLTFYKCMKDGCEALIIVDNFGDREYVVGSALTHPHFNYRTFYQFFKEYRTTKAEKLLINLGDTDSRIHRCYHEILRKYEKAHINLKGVHLFTIVKNYMEATL